MIRPLGVGILPDIVRAEERGSIAAKGIRREVRVLAVAGLRDDHDPAAISSRPGD